MSKVKFELDKRTIVAYTIIAFTLVGSFIYIAAEITRGIGNPASPSQSQQQTRSRQPSGQVNPAYVQPGTSLSSGGKVQFATADRNFNLSLIWKYDVYDGGQLLATASITSQGNCSNPSAVRHSGGVATPNYSHPNYSYENTVSISDMVAQQLGASAFREGCQAVYPGQLPY